MTGPIVMVAGMPRTGSIRTYNVARHLIQTAGFTPWSVHIQPDPISVFQLAVRHRVAASDRICIKVHARYEGTLPQGKVLCNLRDARDALVSCMRFMRCSFEGFRASLELVDYYLAAVRRARRPLRGHDGGFALSCYSEHRILSELSRVHGSGDAYCCQLCAGQCARVHRAIG